MSIRTSESIKAISAALLAFQGAVDGVGKSAQNPAFKRDGKALRYANLEAVIDTAKPELQAVGLLFVQSAGAIVDGVMAMTTRIIHAQSGEWIEGTMDICLGKRDPQGVGSAQTYAQRYHLMAMLGLPPIDDDGEAAIDRNNQRPTPERSVASTPRVAANSSSLTEGEGTALTRGPATQEVAKPRLSKVDARDVYAKLQTDLRAKGLDLKDIKEWLALPDTQSAVLSLPEDWELNMRDAIKQAMEEAKEGIPK